MQAASCSKRNKDRSKKRKEKNNYLIQKLMDNICSERKETNGKYR
jgi:hypothetical protein